VAKRRARPMVRATLRLMWRRAATTMSHVRGGTEIAGQIRRRGEGVDVRDDMVFRCCDDGSYDTGVIAFLLFEHWRHCKLRVGVYFAIFGANYCP